MESVLDDPGSECGGDDHDLLVDHNYVHGPRGGDFSFVGEIPVERQKSVDLSDDDVCVADVEGVEDDPVVDVTDERNSLEVNIVDGETPHSHPHHHVHQDVQLKYVNWLQHELVLLVYFVDGIYIEKDEECIKETCCQFVE